MLTNLAQVQDQIQTFWSPTFTKELREALLLPALVSKQYEGDIKKGGDRVKISQLNAPTGELLDVGVNADSFNSEAMNMESTSLIVDKRAVASFKVADLVELQSLIDRNDPQVSDALKYAIIKQMNTHIYSKVSPSTSAPDHDLSVATLDASALLSIWTLAQEAKWPEDGQWYGVVSPTYYSHILAAQTLTSSDYVDGTPAVVGGQVVNKRFGFNLLVDNSRSGKYGIFFHPSFMNMAMQQQVQVKISDRHALGEFGYIMSADVVFGAALGIDGNVKHIRITG